MGNSLNERRFETIKGGNSVGKSRFTKSAIFLSGFVAISSVMSSMITVEAASQAPTTITVMTWGNDQTTTFLSQTLKAIDPKLAKEYVFKPLLASGDSGVVSKYKMDLSAHEPVPDILQMNATDLPAVWNTGTIVDLTPLLKPYQNQMTSATKTLISFKGKEWAFPYQIKSKLWYYRKDMFKAAGINVNAIHNVAQFIQAGKKLQKKFPHSYMWNIGSPIAGYDLGMILTGNGGQFTNSKGQFVINTNPGIKKAFLALKQLNDSGVVANMSDFTPAWSKGLANGTVASTLNASWLHDFLPSYSPKLSNQWGVAQWPVVAGAQGGSEAGGSIFVIPQGAPDKDAAIQLLTKLFMTKKGNLAFYKAMGESTFLNSVKSTVDKISNPYFGTNFVTQYNKSLTGFKEMNYDPQYANELTIVNDYLQQYLAGKQTLQQALDGAQKTVQSQVGNPWVK